MPRIACRLGAAEQMGLSLSLTLYLFYMNCLSVRQLSNVVRFTGALGCFVLVQAKQRHLDFVKPKKNKQTKKDSGAI